MMTDVTVVSQLAAGAVWFALSCSPKSLALQRLSFFSENGNGREKRAGAVSVLANANAYIKNGASLVSAFEQQGGQKFFTPAVTEERLKRIFMLHRRDESADDIERVAADTAVACRLSETLGCQAVRCLETVAAEHKRQRETSDLRSQALSMPQATVRLLTILPFVIIFFSILCGANPLSFLFSSFAGFCCMFAAAILYAAGAVWVKALIDGFMKESQSIDL